MALSDRLPLALASGLLTLPEAGRIAVAGARIGDDLSALPPGQVEVIQRHQPDHGRFAGQGYAAATAPTGPYALSIVCLPRARAEGQALLAAVAAVTEGPVVIDGQKTDGIESMLRELRARGPVSEAVTKAHGKLFVLTSPPDLSDWLAPEPTAAQDGFLTAPGVFSADRPDPASALLAAALPAKLPPRLADLGAGWGYLARAIMSRDGVKSLDMVEADRTALDCAIANVPDPRAHAHWADALSWKPASPLDGVVMNPPFHTGRSAEASLGQGFIRAAARVLSPRGQLWLVANRHLPYEKTLSECFREVAEIGGTEAFKLMHAAHPLRGDRGKEHTHVPFHRR